MNNKNIKNVLWNLIGLGLPLLIAAVTVPKLLSQIGVQRFGFLSLAWGLVGYAGALDLGVGRATTQHIAALIGAGNIKDVPDVVASAIRITQISGIVGMVIIALLATSGVYEFIPTDDVTEREIKISMFLLALALPLQSISATYRGVNEGFEKFKAANIVRVGLGTANFAAPCLVSFFSVDLYWLVATLVVSRMLGLFFYRMIAKYCIYEFTGVERGVFRKEHSRSLMEFGGWLTVTSIISPVLVQADRFFVGYLLSAAAVTVYVLPYEVTVQAMIIVGAATTVFFPRVAGMLKISKKLAYACFKNWLRKVAICMFVITGGLAYAMPYVLTYWLGEDLDKNSIIVGQVLCLGVFCNSIGAMYYSWLHANGQTKSTAILHIIEVPLYILSLYWLISSFGIVGAAIAWVIRVALDALLLALVSSFHRELKQL